jgi:hypothetical protein
MLDVVGEAAMQAVAGQAARTEPFNEMFAGPAALQLGAHRGEPGGSLLLARRSLHPNAKGRLELAFLGAGHRSRSRWPQQWQWPAPAGPWKTASPRPRTDMMSKTGKVQGPSAT